MSAASGAVRAARQRQTPPAPPATKLHTFSFAHGRAPRLDSTPVEFCTGFTVGRNDGGEVPWHVDITVEEEPGRFVTNRYDLAPLYDSSSPLPAC